MYAILHKLDLCTGLPCESAISFPPLCGAFASEFIPRTLYNEFLCKAPEKSDALTYFRPSWLATKVDDRAGFVYQLEAR